MYLIRFLSLFFDISIHIHIKYLFRYVLIFLIFNGKNFLYCWFNEFFYYLKKIILLKKNNHVKQLVLVKLLIC